MLSIGLPSMLVGGIIGGALAGLVLAIAGYWLGLGLLAAEVAGLIAYHVAQTGDLTSTMVLYSIVWAALLVAVGFGLEPFAERIGARIYRIPQQTMMYASVAMLVVMFVGSLTWMVPAAFIGAVAGGMLSGTSMQRAATDGVGVLLAIFGPKGIRLLCACSLATLVLSLGPMVAAGL